MWKNVPVTPVALVASFALGALLFSESKSSVSAPPGNADRTEVFSSKLPYQVALQDAAASAKKDETPAQGWIGVMLEEKDKKLTVGNVFPGGPAAFAGVRAGDDLVKVGGTAVDSTKKAVELIEKLTPHQLATITISRDGKPRDLKVNTGSLVEFHEKYVREMMSRDPRDPNFAKDHGVSSADMSVELVRRMFEQNQRLETTLHDVLTELQALRAEIREKKK